MVAAAYHQVIHIADGGSMDLNQYLVFAVTRLGGFADAQSLDPVEAVAKHRAHCCLAINRG